MKKLKLLILTLTLILGFTSIESQAKVYPFVTNNKIELLHDPYASKDLKLDLVRNAKHHIHIMTYFWDKSNFPSELASALNEAHKRGVEVRIISTLFPSVITDIFQKAKKRLDLKNKNPNVPFIYLPLSFHRSLTKTNNIHEKVFIVDGEVAITGGRNIADSALRGKDMEILMKGDIVHQMQEHFKIMFDFVMKLKNEEKCLQDSEVGITNFENCLNENAHTFQKDDENFFPKVVENFGELRARVLTHEAVIKQYENNYSITERLTMPDDILDTITSSDFETLRTYNYFILPTDRYKDFLIGKKREGKNIKIITNSFESATFSSNKGYVLGLPYMAQLLKEDIEIFQWKKDPFKNGKLAYVHSKVMTFDDERAIVGSHNFGFGSTMSSNELAVEFFSKELTGELNKIFDEEIHSEVVTKKANNELVEKEKLENLRLLKLLNKDFIRDIIKELY